jgi:hypothetical protein
MSKDFEQYIEQEQEGDRLRAEAAEEKESAIDIFSPATTDSEIEFDLRAEIYAQTRLLKAIRSHLFHVNGRPKTETEASEITAYMNSSMKLLGMLQAFESSLKTDAEVRRLEMAIEMAMEDCPCPEFVTALVDYLEGDLI